MQYPDPRYFDYAASCPPFPQALSRFGEVAGAFYGNPSSLHSDGLEANKKLRELKKEFCNLVNFFDGRLLLCSSGTEANNLIIEGHMQRFPDGSLLVAEDVHDCIWYATEKYKDSIDILPVDTGGHIHPDALNTKLRKDTTLVCINHAGNELGTIHPVSVVADICSMKNIKLLVDGAQALGHIPVDLSDISCDYYSFSSHKFGGIRSSGGVLIRDDDFEPLLRGGKQEWGLRPGTENPAAMAATFCALQLCHEKLNQEMQRLTGLKEYFLEAAMRRIEGILVNNPEDGLPGFVSVSFPGYVSNEIVAGLSIRGFSVSSGSACHASRMEPSRILLAMGRTKDEATGTIRITMGYGTTKQAVDGLLGALVNFIQEQN